MSDLKTTVKSTVQTAAQAAAQNPLQTTATGLPAEFTAIVQADMRRERRLLYAELVILALLLGLVGLRFWMAQ